MASDPASRARALSSVAEAAALYRDWASTYEADVFGAGGFTGTARIAELLGEHLEERTAPVLDLGCGTGGVGVRLAELGVTTVDGVDLSPEMLAVAARTGAYRDLTVADLTRPDPAVRGPYAALVSAGTFTSGHVGADAVPALLRLVSPGGLIAWVVGAAVWPAFASVLDDAGVLPIHRCLEPIRVGGAPESMMVVARTSHGSPP